MTVRFALDTFRGIVHGDRERRIQAALTFGLWFVAGAFVVSTLQYYFLPFEGTATALVGGLVVSTGMAAIKFS